MALFTCRGAPLPPPPAAAPHLLKLAVCKARDLEEADIDFELIALGGDFDYASFYAVRGGVSCRFENFFNMMNW